MKQTNFHPIYLLPRVGARETRDQVVMETMNRRGRKLTSSLLIHLHFYPTNERTIGRNSDHRLNGTVLIQLRLPACGLKTVVLATSVAPKPAWCVIHRLPSQRAWKIYLTIKKKMCEDTNATLRNFDSWMWKDWSAQAGNIPAERRGFLNSVLWFERAHSLVTCKGWLKSL